MMAQALCDQLFADVDGELQHPSDAEDLFGILEAWEDCVTPVAALRRRCRRRLTPRRPSRWRLLRR